MGIHRGQHCFFLSLSILRSTPQLRPSNSTLYSFLISHYHYRFLILNPSQLRYTKAVYHPRLVTGEPGRAITTFLHSIRSSISLEGLRRSLSIPSLPSALLCLSRRSPGRLGLLSSHSGFSPIRHALLYAPSAVRFISVYTILFITLNCYSPNALRFLLRTWLVHSIPALVQLRRGESRRESVVV